MVARVVYVPKPPASDWVLLREGMRVNGARLCVSDARRGAPVEPYVRNLRAVSDVYEDDKGVLRVDFVTEAIWYRIADGLPARDGEVQTWAADQAWAEFIPAGPTWQELYDQMGEGIPER